MVFGVIILFCIVNLTFTQHCVMVMQEFGNKKNNVMRADPSNEDNIMPDSDNDNHGWNSFSHLGRKDSISKDKETETHQIKSSIIYFVVVEMHRFWTSFLAWDIYFLVSSSEQFATQHGFTIKYYPLLRMYVCNESGGEVNMRIHTYIVAWQQCQCNIVCCACPAYMLLHFT